jgi:hypothetical protein
VYVWEQDLGTEVRYHHDVVVIRARSGAIFCFDSTGYQYGLRDFLHKWEPYKAYFDEGQDWATLNAGEERLAYEARQSERVQQMKQTRQRLMQMMAVDIVAGSF